jgi:hypothetical protein
MNMAVKSMEMALGAIPHPGRVPKQRLLSPKIDLRWQQRCGTFHGLLPIDLGFSRRRQFIGGRAMSDGTWGPTLGHGATRGGAAPPYGVAASWPCSVSPLDSVFVSDK